MAARGASDHQRSHLQEARPHARDGIDQCPDLRPYADQEILIENEEWLNGDNLAVRVLNGEIPIIESLPDRIFDELVVAMILAFTSKSALPVAAVRQFST